jgi:hypothetical protein
MNTEPANRHSRNGRAAAEPDWKVTAAATLNTDSPMTEYCIEARNGSKIGQQIIRVLRLDSDDATQMRRDWIGILRSVARTDEQLFRKFIGFPTKLPDLAKAKARNTRKPGLKQSARYLFDAGTLPEWY